QMGQLFLNLVGNALKFRAKNRTPRIEISYSLVDGNHEISVRDNGIGFDDQYVDRIFKPFQRLHRASEYEGTGIGLAICNKIAQQHGGTLTAKSRPDEGATFILRIPVDRRSPRRSPAPASSDGQTRSAVRNV
ncbi:MAG: PAS domain-containing sensor histidine kinase, partial [Elusimicrobia bacterium]|nr:PAS domain-containing sensor histidine kinase [Elusimicrobiota bacterium]